MPVYLEFRDGHSTLEQSSNAPGKLGPVLGPFLAIRILRDDLRVNTSQHEYSLPRIADWVLYAGVFYADIEIVPEEQMGPGRTRRRRPFDPDLAAI
jgi:hypothetical protein